MIYKTKIDLDNLIKNEVQESTNLEYKNPDSLKDNKKICKSISSMANSNGGTIIYGLCEDNQTKKPVRIEWIKDSQQKERIEQIVQSNITPKIDVIISPIPNPENSNEFCLIVEVPKSDIAPHQDHTDSSRRIFWRRNGFTTREMEYYEIEELFFKRKKPDLNVDLEFPKKFDGEHWHLLVSNNGKVLAEKITIKLLLPREFSILDKDKWEEVRSYPEFLGREYSSHQIFLDRPIYPNLPMEVACLSNPYKKDVGKFGVGFYIVCQDMEIKCGTIHVDLWERRINVEYSEKIGRPYFSSQF